MLFLGSLVAYAVVRLRAAEWPPPGLPPLPAGLLVSTVLLALASVALEVAARAGPTGPGSRRRVALATSLGLAFAFLASQTVCWIGFVRGSPAVTLYGWLFLFLTGLHAAHVIGGIVPLVILTVKAFHGLVPAGGGGGVRACATYWHFLALVWVALYGMLALTS